MYSNLALQMFGQFYKLEDFEYICHGFFFILSDFCSFPSDKFTENMLIYKSWSEAVTQLLLRTLQRWKTNFRNIVTDSFMASAHGLDPTEVLINVVFVSIHDVTIQTPPLGYD